MGESHALLGRSVIALADFFYDGQSLPRHHLLDFTIDPDRVDSGNDLGAHIGIKLQC
jgi:hypothetical protein